LDDLPDAPRDPWPDATTRLHAEWWEARIARQKEIDASIAAKADVEYLYDKPYIDNSRIRVARPFTVESLAPYRTLAVDWDDGADRSGGSRRRQTQNPGNPGRARRGGRRFCPDDSGEPQDRGRAAAGSGWFSKAKPNQTAVLPPAADTRTGKVRLCGAATDVGDSATT
jgi:hypothetical protein